MPRILVANDEPDLVEACQAILEGAGHIVRTVVDGPTALDAVRSWRPDVVVLDWVMPKMDGVTAIRALRGDSSSASIPIVMMSGSDGALEAAKDAGADAFLRKPFEPDELLSAVERLIRGRHAATTATLPDRSQPL